MKLHVLLCLTVLVSSPTYANPDKCENDSFVDGNENNVEGGPGDVKPKDSSPEEVINKVFDTKPKPEPKDPLADMFQPIPESELPEGGDATLAQAYVGIGDTNAGRSGFEPLYLRLRRVGVIPAEAFAEVITERNREECRCKPGKWETRRAKLWSGLKRLLDGMLGRSSSIESTLRRRLSQMLHKAKGDHDQTLRIVQGVRSEALEAFHESVRRDLQFTEVYLEIHETVESAQGTDAANLLPYQLVRETDELDARVLEIELKQEEMETNGKPGAPNGEYLRISMERRDKYEEAAKKRAQLKELLDNWDQGREEYYGKLAYELLVRWELREQRRTKSQQALARLILAEIELRVLEEIMQGKLSGLQVPLDIVELRKIDNFFATNHIYLSGREIFGEFYDPENPANGLSTFKKGGSKESHTQVKLMIDRWLNLWHGRVKSMEQRLRINKAIRAVAVEIARYASRHSLKSSQETVARMTRGIGGGIYRAAAKIGHVTRAEKLLPPPKEMPPHQKELLETAKADFESLSGHIRAQAGEGAGPAEVGQVADWVSSLQQYVTEKEQRNEELDVDIKRLFQSAQGIEIHNWMIANAFATEAQGQPYSLVVSNRIMVAQLEHLQGYDKLGPELVQNVFTWGSTAAGFYFLVMPVANWIGSFFG